MKYYLPKLHERYTNFSCPFQSGLEIFCEHVQKYIPTRLTCKSIVLECSFILVCLICIFWCYLRWFTTKESLARRHLKQGCCLTGAQESEDPTIYPRANREPERAPLTYDSQTNFQWTNNKIPCSFCTFKMTTENVWSSSTGKEIFLPIKGKQTALCLSSWSFSSENGVEWV